MSFVRKQANKSRACEIVGISRSTLYYARKAAVKDAIEQRVLEIFDSNNGNYGSPRIKAVLNKEGAVISKRRIIKILKAYGRESKHGRRKLARNIHTATEQRFIEENLIKGYQAKESCEVWQMDATELKCSDGKLTVCGIIDIYDKTVAVEYGKRENKELVCATIEKRIRAGRPMVLHMDRGAANCSKKVKGLLLNEDILKSMSAPHSPNENQYIETFWKTLKVEVGESKRRKIAEMIMILDYYVNYYNTERLHSSIEYQTPQEKFLSGLAQREISAQ